MNDKKETLEERVKKFRALELPGQPRMMHMGTLYLVEDLFRELEALRRFQTLLR